MQGQRWLCSADYSGRLIRWSVLMHLSSASPRGGGPQADVGEYGDFMGTLQQISALVVGEMWGLRFLNALLLGRMRRLRFRSTERRLGTINCSLDRW